MSYRERQRLADIQAAIDAIRSHMQRGDLSEITRTRAPAQRNRASRIPRQLPRA
jgi:hypothetical protein